MTNDLDQILYLVVMGLLAVTGPWLAWRGGFADRSRGRRRCPRCWYELGPPDHDDTPDPAALAPVTCPECGHITTKPHRLLRTRRRKSLILLGLILIAVHVYGYEVRRRVTLQGESWAAAVVPNTVHMLIMPWRDADGFDEADARFHDRRAAAPGKPNPQRFWWWQKRLYVWSCARIAGDSKHARSGHAMQTLAHLAHYHRSDAALDALIDHTRHADPAVRKEAVRFLGVIGQMWVTETDRAALAGRVRAALVACRDEDDDAGVAAAARTALGRVSDAMWKGDIPTPDPADADDGG